MAGFVVRRSWIAQEGDRLGPRTFAEGGLAARARIRNGDSGWMPLGEVANVFRGPLHVRIYIRDAKHGVPYVTATDVNRADLPREILLSTARTPELPVLLVESGWTLISCAGTIGNTTYVRDELASFAVSQDMLRVAPRDHVMPGYLFAFLSSRAAKAMMRLRTYGSVVDRIEPKHITDLPVPVPPMSFQVQIHDLVARAASTRTAASGLLDEASGYFDELAGPLPSAHDHSRTVGVLSSSRLANRLDAFHHVGWATEGKLHGERLDSFADICIPRRMRLIHAAQGVPFLTGVDIYQIRPVALKRIARWSPGCEELRVKAGTILMQVDGQRYGLIGRPSYAGKRLDKSAISWHLARIETNHPGRIFAFACSQAGRRVR